MRQFWAPGLTSACHRQRLRAPGTRARCLSFPQRPLMTSTARRLQAPDSISLFGKIPQRQTKCLSCKIFPRKKEKIDYFEALRKSKYFTLRNAIFSTFFEGRVCRDVRGGKSSSPRAQGSAVERRPGGADTCQSRSQSDSERGGRWRAGCRWPVAHLPLYLWGKPLPGSGRHCF